MVRRNENGKRKKMTVITMTEEKNTDQSMAERRKIKIKKIKIKKKWRKKSEYSNKKHEKKTIFALHT